MDEQLTLKYIEVEKMKCKDKEITVSKRSIETLIEMAIDYSKILDKEASEITREYNKLKCQYKSQELKKIADDLIEKTGYCKECKQAKEIDDIGMSSFEIMGNRNRVKKE